MNHAYFKPQLWVVFGFSIAMFITLTHADDARTWTDKTGKFKIEAKFLGIENGKAKLEKPDGTLLQIDLEKLSTEDRKLAEKLQKAKDSDNPFEKAAPAKKEPEPRRPATRPGRRGDPIPPPADVPALAEVDWAGVKQLSLFGSDWKAPTITPAEAKLSWQPRPVILPPKADFFENVTGVVTSPQAKRAVVMTALERPGNKEVQGRLFLCDLEKGKALKQFTFNGKLAPLALSPDGTQLLIRHEVFGFDNSDKVELWQLSDTGVHRGKHWVPVENPNDRGRDVSWAAFTADGKALITLVSGGTITWWDLAEVKPSQSLALGGGFVSTPGISPDGKYLACVVNQDLVLVDAVSGETTAVKPTGRQMHQPHLSFSPDGKKLACSYMNKVDVFDLAEGNLETSVSINMGGGATPCFWTSPSALLVGQPLAYVETSMNLNIWGYDGTDKVTPLGDYGVMYVHDGVRNVQGLIALKLPHQPAVQLVEQAKKDPNLFVLKPGVRVSLDVSQISEPGVREEAKAALEAKLEANSNPVGPGGVTLVASLERGKDHEVSYRTFGTPPFAQGTKYTVTGWVYSLKLLSGGKTHWQTGAGNYPPPIIHLKRDESVESHLKQYSVPSGSYFKFIELPKYVARVQGDAAATSTSLRRSQVTANGIR